MSLRTRARNTFATALAVAMIASGAVLAAPAAYAVDEDLAASQSHSAASAKAALEESGSDSDPAEGEETPDGGAASEDTSGTAAENSAEETEQATYDGSGGDENGSGDGTGEEGSGEEGAGEENDDDGAADTDFMSVGSLDWGLRTSFRNYVVSPIAGGKITVYDPATQSADNGEFHFTQVKSPKWNHDKGTGTLNYSGAINFTGHDGALDLTISNPTIKVDARQQTATISVKYRSRNMETNKWAEGTDTLATLELSDPTHKPNGDAALVWSKAKATLTKTGSSKIFQDFYDPGDELDAVTFVAGDAAENVEASNPPKKKGKTPKKSSQKKVAPSKKATSSEGGTAGSLRWGVSSEFAAYATGKIAKGSVLTSGVGRNGGAYVFPQATGGKWNAKSDTGTVRYSGVVTFTGHHGLMSESFANPVITVRNDSSGTITAGGRTFTLNLAAASKSSDGNGAVTWQNVPVGGSISGSGGGGGGTVGVDPLSFTVGVASGATFGSTAAGEAAQEKRTPAATAPATTGITVLTDADKLKPGARIEIEAPGFDPEDEGVLVVLYSEPILLDEKASADANGVVRWTGTLPKDIELGEHVLTLQGSIDAGAVIDIVDKDAEKKSASSAAQSEPLAVAQNELAAGLLNPTGGMALWEWWASAAGLILIAACTTTLAVRQRRMLK